MEKQFYFIEKFKAQSQYMSEYKLMNHSRINEFMNFPSWIKSREFHATHKKWWNETRVSGPWIIHPSMIWSQKIEHVKSCILSLFMSLFNHVLLFFISLNILNELYLLKRTKIAYLLSRTWVAFGWWTYQSSRDPQSKQWGSESVEHMDVIFEKHKANLPGSRSSNWACMLLHLISISCRHS